MDTSQRIGRILGVICLLISVTACNQTGSPTSPSTDGSSTPTAAPPSFNTPPRAGALVQGRVSNLPGTSRRVAGLDATVTVKVVGTDLSAPVSPTGEFSLEGVPTGEIKLEFTGGYTTTPIGGITTGDRIDIQVRISGSRGLVESSVHVKADSSTSVDGAVTSVSGSCPNQTIVVNGWTLTLTNTAQTICRDIRVGVKVKVKGNFASGRTITVIRIEINGRVDDDRDTDDKDSDKDSDDDDSDDGDSDSDRRRRLLRSLRQFTFNW